MIGLEVKSSLAELDKTLEEYANATGKNMAQVLAKKGKSLGKALFIAYATAAPKPGLIEEEAAARGYAMGRKGTPHGVSPAAERMAANFMEGNTFIAAYRDPTDALGRPLKFGGQIRGVYAGKRGRLVSSRTKTKRMLDYDTAKSLLKSDKRYNHAGYVDRSKKWNKRNVQVYFELMLRERGRKSIAAPWTVARKANTKGEHALWRQQNLKAETPWTSEAELNGTKDSAWFALRSNAPGQEKHQEKAVQAFKSETKDMRDYLLELARTGLSHAAYKAAKKAGTL